MGSPSALVVGVMKEGVLAGMLTVLVPGRTIKVAGNKKRRPQTRFFFMGLNPPEAHGEGSQLERRFWAGNVLSSEQELTWER
jgi:hypothetical protein